MTQVLYLSGGRRALLLMILFERFVIGEGWLPRGTQSFQLPLAHMYGSHLISGALKWQFDDYDKFTPMAVHIFNFTLVQPMRYADYYFSDEVCEESEPDQTWANYRLDVDLFRDGFELRSLFGSLKTNLFRAQDINWAALKSAWQDAAKPRCKRLRTH